MVRANLFLHSPRRILKILNHVALWYDNIFFLLLQGGHKSKASKCCKPSVNSPPQSEAMHKVAASCASQLSQVNKDNPSSDSQHTSAVPAGPVVLVSKNEDQVRSEEDAGKDVKTGASRETSDVWHELWLLIRVDIVVGPLFVWFFCRLDLHFMTLKLVSEIVIIVSVFFNEHRKFWIIFGKRI